MPSRKLLLLAAATGCLGITVPNREMPEVVGEGTRVLFVGNSLTGNVPAIVRALALSRGEQIAYSLVVRNNYALIDHWKEGFVQTVISQGNYAVVVLQQGPSSTTINRDSLRLVSQLYANAVATANGRTALYAAWPQVDRRQDFERAAESYALAADYVGGILFPISSAWLAAWRLDPDVPLYADALHASAYGEYLTALVVYARLMNATPLGLPSTLALPGGQLTVPPATAALLQQAAAEALE